MTKAKRLPLKVERELTRFLCSWYPGLTEWRTWNQGAKKDCRRLLRQAMELAREEKEQ